jgi:hypothetical protein
MFRMAARRRGTVVMAAGECRLTLVIPGLFGPAAIGRMPAAWRDLSLPALERLLSRATRRDLPGPGLERTLFALFEVETPPDGDLPVAAVTRQWDGQDAGVSWWLRADPVHLRADRDRLVMLGNATLDVSGAESAALAAELNGHYAAEGWDLRAGPGHRWYLRLREAPRLITAALSEVLGQDVLHHMPQGPDERRWRSILNEVQMVLHASAVNRDREAQGRAAVNSLWFWGGGRLPRAPQAVWSRVWGNDALTQGLAMLAGAPCDVLPADGAQWLEQRIAGRHLLVLDGVREKAQFGDIEGWRGFLETLHEYWLEPLFAALRQRRIAELEIAAADGVVSRVTARAARRWWVRRRPLREWL